MGWVTISHPEAGTARVAESSVPYHAVTGWTVIPDPPPPAPKSGDETGGEGDDETGDKAGTKTEPPKARRSSTREND